MKKTVTPKAARTVATPPLHALLEGITQDTTLPWGGTELLLVELDPHRAHVYWQIAPADYDPARFLCLRVYDITTSACIEKPEQVFDVGVRGETGRWYLDFWRDNRTFTAEIGYRNPDGGFEVLARSNDVHTPVAEPPDVSVGSQHHTPDGRTLHTDLPEHVRRSAAHAPPPDLEAAAATSAEAVPDAPVPTARKTAEAESKVAAHDDSVEAVPAAVEPKDLLDPAFPLAAWFERQLAVPDEPAIPVVQGTPAAVAAAGEAMVVFDDEAETESGAQREHVFPDAALLQDFVAENHAAVTAFYEAVEALPPPARPVPQPAHDGVEEAVIPAAETAATPVPAPRTLALEHAIGLSSAEFAGRRDLFDVHAELHLYGRTEPGTRLTLYGQTIKVEADGSFSIRRNIPAGAMVIPLLANP